LAVQFNLEHDELLLLEGTDPLGRRLLLCIARASNKSSFQKQIKAPQLGTQDTWPEALNVNIRDSAARETNYFCEYPAPIRKNGRQP
jgi:hypothetical protein